MIGLILILIAITVVVPVLWFGARRRIQWHRRGVLDIAISAIYFALIFEAAAIFHTVLA